MTAAAAADQYPRVHLTLKSGEPPMLNIRAKTVSEFDSVVQDAEKSEYLGPLFFDKSVPTPTAEAPTASAAGEASTTSTDGAADTSSAPSVDPGKALEALKAEIAAKNAAAETPAPQAGSDDPLAAAMAAAAAMQAKGGAS